MRVKVEPLSQWLDVTVSELLSPEARSKAVADFARAALRDAQETNRRSLGSEAPFEQFVDGRAGAALESVDPDRGRIVFEFELINDVLQWVLAALIERSPRRSGDYMRGHRLFADEREIAADGEIPPAAEYSFTNTVPYTRRLEIGKTKSGRDFLVSVPNRIYERTAKDARARFGNVVQIRMTYRAVIGGAQVNAEKLPVASRRARDRRGRFVAAGRPHNVSTVRFPTITVTPN
ncbi:hypothetical protein [Shinella pollutisoli]|uniref:Uncharacterized protein n=1 Tax=Shinella pollutisoli TaxID=2250594 RepID=A0ABV7D9C2_9HYPH|nr:hypothetical protein [Shinella pollutisoli]